MWLILWAYLCHYFSDNYDFFPLTNRHKQLTLEVKIKIWRVAKFIELTIGILCSSPKTYLTYVHYLHYLLTYFPKLIIYLLCLLFFILLLIYLTVTYFTLFTFFSYSMAYMKHNNILACNIIIFLKCRYSVVLAAIT